jgi:hypothetical protein
MRNARTYPFAGCLPLPLMIVFGALLLFPGLCWILIGGSIPKPSPIAVMRILLALSACSFGILLIRLLLFGNSSGSNETSTRIMVILGIMMLLPLLFSILFFRVDIYVRMFYWIYPIYHGGRMFDIGIRSSDFTTIVLPLVTGIFGAILLIQTAIGQWRTAFLFVVGIVMLLPGLCFLLVGGARVFSLALNGAAVTLAPLVGFHVRGQRIDFISVAIVVLTLPLGAAGVAMIWTAIRGWQE